MSTQNVYLNISVTTILDIFSKESSYLVVM